MKSAACAGSSYTAAPGVFAVPEVVQIVVAGGFGPKAWKPSDALVALGIVTGDAPSIVISPWATSAHVSACTIALEVGCAFVAPLVQPLAIRLTPPAASSGAGPRLRT